MGCPYTGPLKLTLSWHRTLQRETDMTRFDSWKKGGNRPHMGDETLALRPDNKWWKLGAQMAHEDSTINHSTTLEGVLIRMWIWINGTIGQRMKLPLVQTRYGGLTQQWRIVRLFQKSDSLLDVTINHWRYNNQFGNRTHRHWICLNR